MGAARSAHSAVVSATSALSSPVLNPPLERIGDFLRNVETALVAVQDLVKE